MELDELKSAWAQYDKILSKNLKLNEELLRSIKFDKFNHAIRKPLDLELLNMVIQFIAILMVTMFTVRLSNEIPYYIAGIFSTLLCATSLAFSAVKATRFYKLLNFNIRITAFQKEFTQLRIFIIRLRKIEHVLAGLIGVLLFPLLMKAVAGVDLLGNHAIIIPGIIATLAIGFAIGTWLNLFIYDKGLKEAEKFLDLIKNYEEEAL